MSLWIQSTSELNFSPIRKARPLVVATRSPPKKPPTVSLCVIAHRRAPRLVKNTNATSSWS